jgi:hypothetical protein
MSAFDPKRTLAISGRRAFIEQEERTPGRSIIAVFPQVGVVLKPEGLVLQTSHRAWPPEGQCI